MSDITGAAAYGGEGWSPRTAPLEDEIGTLWGRCGLRDEWGVLRAVLLHRPGAELAVPDPDAAQLLAPVDPERAAAEHDLLARAYREEGVLVRAVEPAGPPTPNLIFCADLFLMTPEGAILGRPASTVRAGEEIWIARRLAELGIPIVRIVRGQGTFEGADAMWLDRTTVLVGRGLRTNAEGARQVASILGEMGVEAIPVDLPWGAMHLMGMLRIADRDLAIAWPGRLAVAAVETLRRRGYRVLFLPDGPAAERTTALNFVTLGPGRVLMAEGYLLFERFFEKAGLACRTTPVAELRKAAGGIGCLTGILERAPGA
ncbi:MAG TPA: arginine deiminase family protein [Methylomirabilota bacterium]|nr:arginine deiminase family protein [Methylomirabilota bacterium]